MMKPQFVAAFFALLLLVFLTAACGSTAPPATPTPPPTSTAEPVTLRFVGNPGGFAYDLDQSLVDQFTVETGIEVEMLVGPESATERLAFYQEELTAESADIDIYQIDVVWPGLLAEDLLPLNEYDSDIGRGHFEPIIENNTVDGNLIGAPFYTDAGILYYRTDLLEKYGYDGPPETWTALETMAAEIQDGERSLGNTEFWGYVWQGAAYEGLTCNALEWQVSFEGGTIVDDNGAVTVNNENTAAALNRAAGWVDTISPPSVTGYQEEDARAVWQAGNAAFMRNWPYAYALGQEETSLIRDNFGVSVLPAAEEGTHAATLGGWQLGVSKYTRYPEEATRFVAFMTSRETQHTRAVEGAFLPTYAELYDDEQVLTANPYFADLKSVFTGGAVARPSNITGDVYARVSAAYFTAVHRVLTGQDTAESALDDVERGVQQLLEGDANE